MEERTVASWVADQLAAWGVQSIYGVVGDAILPLVDAVSNHPRLKFYNVKHEGTAALMASAEAKLTGRIGVCAATSGPGTANLINGLADAKSDQVPVLAITGQVDSFNLGTDYKQYVDQGLLLSAVVSYSGLVANQESCDDLLVRALRSAGSGGSVVHVGFTKDIWTKTVTEPIRSPEPFLHTLPQSPSYVIDEAVYRLNQAERPVILVGRGIHGLRDEVIALAEKWQSGLCMTMPAKGMLPGNHRLVIGGLGEGGSETTTTMLAESDLVLIIGATWWPDQYVPKTTRIIQLDAVPDNIGRRMPVEYGVVGDLRELLPRISAAITPRERRPWIEPLETLKEQWLGRIGADIREGGGPVHPARLVKSLEKMMAEDAVVSLDVGDHTLWFNRIFAGSRQDVLISGTWRTMGFGLPAAMAAKLAAPERQSVALVGDGGLAMYLGDFSTAVRYRLPITVVVVNNGYLGLEKSKMETKGMNYEATALTNPNFARFAEACGGQGFRVEKAEELEPVLMAALKSDVPVIVDVITESPVFPAVAEKS